MNLPEPKAWIVSRAMAEDTLEWCKPPEGEYLSAEPLYTRKGVEPRGCPTPGACSCVDEEKEPK